MIIQSVVPEDNAYKYKILRQFTLSRLSYLRAEERRKVCLMLTVT